MKRRVSVENLTIKSCFQPSLILRFKMTTLSREQTGDNIMQNMINGLDIERFRTTMQRLKTTIQKARQHYAPIRAGYPARRTKSPCVASPP